MSDKPFGLSVIQGIDRFTEIFTTRLLILLVVPLVLANVAEVILRYALQAPTIWALEVTTQTFGALFMLGSAYALMKGAHIRTDIFWDKFTPRTKGTIDTIAYICLFAPAMLILLYVSGKMALYSYSIAERSSSGIWRVPLWPFRFVVPVATVLLLLQGVSEALKSMHAWRTNSLLVEHEKLEI